MASREVACLTRRLDSFIRYRISHRPACRRLRPVGRCGRRCEWTGSGVYIGISCRASRLTRGRRLLEHNARPAHASAELRILGWRPPLLAHSAIPRPTAHPSRHMFLRPIPTRSQPFVGWSRARPDRCRSCRHIRGSPLASPPPRESRAAESRRLGGRTRGTAAGLTRRGAGGCRRRDPGR